MSEMSDFTSEMMQEMSDSLRDLMEESGTGRLIGYCGLGGRGRWTPADLKMMKIQTPQ